MFFADALSLAEDCGTASIWRYTDDGDGLDDGGLRRYRGTGDGQSDWEYIFGRP